VGGDNVGLAACSRCQGRDCFLVCVVIECAPTSLLGFVLNFSAGHEPAVCDY